MSEWRNLKAIENDLMCAQGRIAIDIGRPVYCNEKPPLLDCEEETEEEFYKYGTADGDFSAAPELDLIKDMLSLVQASDIPAEEEEQKENVITNKSNINPDVSKRSSTPTVLKMKRNRNAAMASLLQAIGEPKPVPVIQKLTETTENSLDSNINGKIPNEIKKDSNHKVKVDGKREIIFPGNNIKPNTSILEQVSNSGTRTDLSEAIDNVVETEQSKESISKVNTWLDSHYTNPVAMNPSSMFKRKSNRAASKTSSSPSSESKCDNSYKPSDLANEYYQKYMERSRLKELVEQDIWTKAEMQMKEIDERRKLEAEQSENDAAMKSSSTASVRAAAGQENDDDVLGGHAYMLPFNRHIWTDDCLICEAMERHNFDVKSMKERPELLDPPPFMAEKIHENS